MGKWLIGLFLVVSSCKQSPTSISPVSFVDVQPERPLSLKGFSYSQNVEHDHRGYPKVSFVLRLDMLQNLDQNVPVCMRPLPDNLEVAEIHCVKGSKGSARLTVAHLDQVCYRDPSFESVIAKNAVNLKNCKSSELLIYHFQPEIKVDIESR